MAATAGQVLHFIGRSSKRIAVSVVGAVFLLGGLVMMVLPGPGIPMILLGLAILATEYVWAAVALERTKRMAGRGGRFAKDAWRKVTRRPPRNPDQLVR